MNPKFDPDLLWLLPVMVGLLYATHYLMFGFVYP